MPDRKFMFDVHVFDAPPKEEIVEDLPPPPPTFSEEELAAAKDMAFEQGRMQGHKEERESREQYIATLLDTVSQNFSQLFAAETMREIVFEKEALRLAVAALDLLFPSLDEKLGHGEAYKIIEKTLIAHRKTKEITIQVSPGTKGEIEALITRIREGEHEDVSWRVVEIADMPPGGAVLEWSDGGAVRDSARAAAEVRRQLVALFGAPLSVLTEEGISEMGQGDVHLTPDTESGDPAAAAPATPKEQDHE